MVEVDDSVMAKYVINLAITSGDTDIPRTVSYGQYDEKAADLHWSLDDMKPDVCSIEMVDENTVRVSQVINGFYQVMVNSGGFSQPADVDSRDVPIHIEILLPLDGESRPTVNGELH